MSRSLLVLAAGLAALAAGGVGAARGGHRARELDDSGRSGAAEVARLFATLSAHLRSSGGDARFAQRLPADEPVIVELMSDIAFAQHSGVVELPRLVRFHVRAIEPVGVDIAEVRATEYWVTRSRVGSQETVRSDVVPVRYAARRDAGKWRIADWEIDEGPADAREAAR